MTRPTDSPTHAPIAYQHLIGFTVLRTLFNSAYRMVYPYQRILGQGVGLSESAMAGVLGLRSLLGLLGPLLAQVTEYRSRRAGMLMGVALFTLGTACAYLWPTAWGLSIALLLGALGKIAFDPAMQAFLGDRIPYERRGAMLAFTELGWSLSFLVGVPLLGLLLAHLGWRATFGIVGLLGALAYLSLARALPHHDAYHTPPHQWDGLGALRAPVAWAVMLLGLSATAANEVVNLVFGLWLEDRFAVTLAGLGGAAALIGLAELGGEGAVMGLADRLGKRRAVGLGLLLNAGAAALLALADRATLPLALGALFAFYITFEFTLVSGIPFVTGVLPAYRAGLMALFVASVSLGRAAGDWLGALLYPYGMGATVLAAVGLNALALLTLRYIPESEASR